MNYNYSKNEYLHIREVLTGKAYHVNPIKIRVPPRTLEPIDELDIIKGLRILSD
tara:strand:+ start:348 stop:509 length:162 start_codon:yes stop_codon:yes gene_type:complete